MRPPPSQDGCPRPVTPGYDITPWSLSNEFRSFFKGIFLEWFCFFQCLVDQHNLIKILNRIRARLYWTGQLVEAVIKLFSPRMSDFQHTGFTLHQPCMFSNQVHTKLLQWWQVAMLTEYRLALQFGLRWTQYLVISDKYVVEMTFLFAGLKNTCKNRPFVSRIV